jgi:hypothetical protein
MKKPKSILYKNGFKYRSHNKGFTVVEENGAFQMEFKNFVGKGIVTSKSFNIRGVAYTNIGLSEESMTALVMGFLKYQESKKNR